jgi:hypothetical protein
MFVLIPAAGAQTTDVGAVAEVRRTVYGVPPQGSELVKRKGDSVVFQEEIETRDFSGAVIRFIDDSMLTIGAKSKVLIDAFVFDPATAQGNALINISVGTLRFVTGDMPKGKTTIKTPTATLVLRGTSVTVHVHPDGTTDATVDEGDVGGSNDVTGDPIDLVSGQGATIGESGNSDFSDPQDPADDGFDGGADSPPEHRRAGSPPSEQGSSGTYSGPSF